MAAKAAASSSRAIPPDHHRRVVVTSERGERGSARVPWCHPPSSSPSSAGCAPHTAPAPAMGRRRTRVLLLLLLAGLVVASVLVVVPAAATLRASRAPDLVYGTAWKRENTSWLVREALLAGYPAIDTANQIQHYDEAGAGEGLRQFLLAEGAAPAATDVFVQTKFTFAELQHGGHLPFDPNASTEIQVRASVSGSRQHLFGDAHPSRTIDLLLLHGFLRTGEGEGGEHRLTKRDWEAWRAMESLVREGQVRMLGMCEDGSVAKIRELYRGAEVKPRVLQTRCRYQNAWSRDIRRVAKELSLQLQCYSIVNGNRKFIDNHASVHRAYEARHGKYTKEQILIRFVKRYFEGASVLTGPGKPQQMLASRDAVLRFSPDLTASEVRDIAVGANDDLDDPETLRVSVSFTNEYDDADLAVYWVNDYLQPVENGLVPRQGGQLTVNTYHNHRFRVFKGDELLMDARVNVHTKGRAQELRFGLHVRDEL